MLQLNSKQPTDLMTYSQSLLDAADVNGQIDWEDAAFAAEQHGIFEDFRSEYGRSPAYGSVDAGEFLIWMGY